MRRGPGSDHPRATFDRVQESLEERAPKRQRPAQVGSKFLLSGLLRCGVCGKPYTGQGDAAAVALEGGAPRCRWR